MTEQKSTYSYSYGPKSLIEKVLEYSERLGLEKITIGEASQLMNSFRKSFPSVCVRVGEK